MAEGLVNHHFKGRLKAYSAGVEPSSINPRAVEAMKEAGIDISGHTVNRPEDFADVDFDFIITLCDHARESCPLFLSQKPAARLHWSYPDPAHFSGTQDEIMQGFRQVRDEMKKKILEHFRQ
jgi:arsenate reductase